MSARGEVERLFWPRLDRGSHLGALRFGVELDGVVEQSYLLDANVLLTRGDGVELVDLVHELEPVLLRRIRAKAQEGRLVVDCRPEFDGVKGGLAASVDGNRVVFYRRNVALALGAAGAEAFSTGLGETEGGISVPFRGDAVVALAFGASSREAVARLDAALQQDFNTLVTSRRRPGRLASAEQPSAAIPDVGTLYRRSLLVLDLLADRDTGAVIAAPELDPEFERSGGYGFVWGRDSRSSSLPSSPRAATTSPGGRCAGCHLRGSPRASGCSGTGRTARSRHRGVGTSSTRPGRSCLRMRPRGASCTTTGSTPSSGRPRSALPSSCSARSRRTGSL